MATSTSGDDRELGLGRAISRRDFVNGVSVAVGASIAGTRASAQVMAPPDLTKERYPPLRQGMRGAHPGSFEVAHATRDRALPPMPATETGEVYDLVVVGAGLSGLAAAFYYRQRAGASATILLLDNHDDFGGHAKRNEFVVDGQTLMATGGSSYMVAPKTWTWEARQILQALGIDRRDSNYRLDWEHFTRMGLGPATFFRKEAFGVDRLVTGGSFNRPTAEYLAKTPLAPQVQADLLRLHTGTTDYLAGLSPAEKIAKLQSMSYRDYLLQVAKVHPDVPSLLHGVWALSTESVTAWFAFYRYRPGFAGLGLTRPGDSPESPDHSSDDFPLPAGNSDIARLLVRWLIPDAMPAGAFAEAMSLRVDYARLDRDGSPVRLRLDSTVVHVAHVGARASAQFERDTRDVEVVYLQDERAWRVTAGHVVLACNNGMIPYLCPELPEAQKTALHQSVRAVNQMTNVLVRDFRALAALKVETVTCPSSFYGSFNLNDPVTLGGIAPPSDPSQPAILNVNTGTNSGILSNDTMTAELMGRPFPAGATMQDRFRALRAALLRAPFETFERAARTQLARALGAGGFDPARDILGITVNRWPHGFAMSRNALYDRSAEEDTPCVPARQPFGRITIANSDASGIDLVQTAFDEAARAVRELESRRYGYYERI